MGWSKTQPIPGEVGSTDNTVWVFEDQHLIDATAKARRIIKNEDGRIDWGDLHRQISLIYPTFPNSAEVVKLNGEITAPSSDPGNNSEIHCEWLDGVTRVTMRKLKSENQFSPELLKTLSRSAKELEMLRFTVDNAHYPIWCLDTDGKVVWFNEAYDNLSRIVQGKPADADAEIFGPPGGIPVPTNRTRRSIAVPGSKKKLWFEISVVQHDTGTLIYAIDVNAIVDAEMAQRNFVQTLAKTFTQLSIGLAIFDRNRQLVLFNPALIDLTALPADFLSARPTIFSFFDRIRDNNMMPEPKNYKSWRDQLSELVDAAASGQYQETWSLASGSVYSVSGRPHPDGAVAFLFEDITAEITLTRRFRSDLELWQAVFDSLDDAVAVFSETGALIFSNSAYQELWDVNPENTFAQTTIIDSIRTWQGQCKASPIWGDIRDFVSMHENRAEWWAEVTFQSDQHLICTVTPVQRGTTLIRFSQTNEKNDADREDRVEHATD